MKIKKLSKNIVGKLNRCSNKVVRSEQISFRITKELNEFMLNYCKKNKTTKSELLLLSICKYLDIKYIQEEIIYKMG